MHNDAAWDDAQWRVRGDTSWRAGCRWLQSRWRSEKLALPPGPSSTSPDRPVASMLPVGSDLNFLSKHARAAVEARLDEGDHSGIIQTDRLYRNLLSSQPLCFNLFGHFQRDPSPLLPWVRTIDPDAHEITGIRLEWAPPRQDHFNGGSAFDAFVEYEAAGRPRFIAVECKYAEHLADSQITVRGCYFEFTDGHDDIWREGAAQRLDRKGLQQFWLNTLLAQSLVARGGHFEQGTSVVMACAGDTAAYRATALVRSELHEPDQWLRWSSYEDVLSAVVEPSADDWKEQFRIRYLDFKSVRHLLASDDPRVDSPSDADELQRLRGALSDLLATGERVTGGGSILGQILRAIDTGGLGDAKSIDIEAITQRACNLALDLKTLRQASYNVWSRMGPRKAGID